MGKIVLEKSKRKIIDSIFEHDIQDVGKCYSIHFVDSEETIWCNNISEIYMAIEQHINRTKLFKDVLSATGRKE